VTDLFRTAAYGGAGWSPRTAPLRAELGSLWAGCGQQDEWGQLRAVLLHRPGAELAVPDPNGAQMLAPIDPALARAQHDRLAEAYRERDVRVDYVDPPGAPPPNLMFVADLVFMTPEGAIVARPASTVRAGEERWVARRLADLGVPILRSVRGAGTFEGADAAWLDPTTVLIGRGLRTNADGAAQVAGTLHELGIRAIVVDLPYGAMHLMGLLRFADRDLAIAWPGRLAVAAVEALRERGYRVAFLPEAPDAERSAALNFVTLAPRRILMTAGCGPIQRWYEDLGIKCDAVPIDELRKAAGGIGCLTGVIARERSG
jgi:N-dimethylarginine dimethylaminohydrolase